MLILQIIFFIYIVKIKEARSYTMSDQNIFTLKCSTMKNKRLCGLAMISVEHEVGQELTEKEFVNDFAKLKARKHL